MNGSIRVFNNIYSFKQFAELRNLSSSHFHATVAQNFVREWLSSTPGITQKTSGSTGNPKIISLSREQILYSIQTSALEFCLNQGDSALLCIDPTFIGGKMMLARAIELQLNLTIIPVSSNPLGDLNESTGFKFAAFVPMQIVTLLKSKEGVSLLNSIEVIIIGGGAVSSEIIVELQQLKSEVYSTYGMTETASHFAVKKLNGSNPDKDFRLIGDVCIALDKRGCLQAKGSITNHQWLVTNDIVEINQQGHFRLIGRIDNVINSGGLKIQVEELESSIATALPDFNFMVSSKPDPVLGESIVLLTSTEPTDHELSRLKRCLPKYHYPREVIKVSELPLTDSGKPDRAKAKALLNS